MICPHCQSQNPDGTRFCAVCGRQITTAPLHQPNLSTATDKAILTPLPAGMKVGDTYTVRQIFEQQTYINSYFVEGVQNVEEVYLMQETLEPGRLGAEIDIARLGLKSAGLRPPFHTFQQTISDQLRTYLVKPQPATPLAQVTAPQELAKVIQWGISLADGLATLHANDIAYGEINRQTVHLDRRTENVSLADFSTCLQLGIESLYQSEAKQLALLLYEMLTGQTQYEPNNPLPEPLDELFSQMIREIKPLAAAELREALQRILFEMRRPAAINLRVAYQTDVGMTRPLNEDSLFVLETTWNNRSNNQPMCLLVVADGMGGHQGGEVASGLAVQTIGRFAFQSLLPVASRLEEGDLDPGLWLKEAIQAANQAIFQQRQQSDNDMGSTIVATVVIQDTAYIAHVGDSRAYRISETDIQQLTTDHSLVERLVATNQITREEARFHPQSNVVYRTLGDREQVEVDTLVFSIPSDVSLLLCSDGLNGMLADAQIQEIVVKALSPQIACQELIRAANKAGGTDNISVMIVRAEPVELRTS